MSGSECQGSFEGDSRARFVHVDKHWEASRPSAPGGRVVLSELPRGNSPVVCRARCLNLVLEGVERYEIDGRIHVVEPGQFLMLDSGTRAEAILPERGITRGLCVYLPADGDAQFDLDRIVPADAPDFAMRSFQLSESTVPFARTLMQLGARLLAQPALSAREADFVVRSTAAAFDAISNDLAGRLAQVPATSPAKRREILQRVERARAFIHDSEAEAPSLASLARVACMSQFHFSRNFRAVVGAAPIEYALRLQMKRAATALSSGEPIAAVAERHGFADTSSFTRAFRRTTGQTPGAVAVHEVAI